MCRTLLLPLILAGFVSVSASAREASPFRAGQASEGAKRAPDARGKIIDELRADYNDVVDDLAKKNVHAEMRAKQQRIIDNLKRLLDEDDPPPNPAANAAPANAPRPPSPPSEPKANPRPAAEPQPGNSQRKPNEAANPLPGKAGEAEPPPRSIDEMLRAKANGGGLMELPPRQREALDTHARDRFLPRYEELLRAYYRTIAESARPDARE